MPPTNIHLAPKATEGGGSAAPSNFREDPNRPGQQASQTLDEQPNPQGTPPNQDSLVNMLKEQNEELTAMLEAANAFTAEKNSRIETLEKQIADLTQAKQVQAEDEKLILLKMSKGLTRPQAVAVILRQRAYDASDIAKSRAAKVAKLKPATA